MGTKRVELSALEVCEIISALKLSASSYRQFARNGGRKFEGEFTSMYDRWLTRCLDIAAKLEDCDRVAIETDEMDEPVSTPHVRDDQGSGFCSVCGKYAC